jgi:hypothetical protein
MVLEPAWLLLLGFCLSWSRRAIFPFITADVHGEGVIASSLRHVCIARSFIITLIAKTRLRVAHLQGHLDLDLAFWIVRGGRIPSSAFVVMEQGGI